MSLQEPKSHWVIDYETIVNCFIAVFESHKTDETHVFVVYDSRNDFPEFLKFLNQCVKNGEYHISFNGINFDAQISQKILEKQKELLKLDTQSLITFIYNYSQEIIGKSNRREFLDYPEYKLKIKQIDLFKLNHWDNPAKMSSLKWIQYAMDWENVEEMPHPHYEPVTNCNVLNELIEYCINDVKSTKKCMTLCKDQITLRKTIGEKYNLNCYSYSNTKIGSKLLLKLYCEKTNRDPKEVEKTRTIRNEIIVKDILFPYIEFKSNTFKDFLKTVEKSIIRNTKGDFSHKISFKGSEFIYGTGGIHQCIASGIYEANDQFVIIDLDVASLYPSIAIVNKMYPAHLGVEFYYVYKEDIVDVRLAEKAKKAKGDKAIVEGFKEAANASYGNSNSQHSWLFDSQYTMQTTINGQLLLTMLVEELLLEFPDATLLQTNTDGATLKLKKSDVDRYYEICKLWEEKTKLILEYAEYKKMVIRDVNNYIGIYTNGKVKCKGTFEWEDLQKCKPSHLHKNKSFLVISKAIYEYFVNGVMPEDYIASNTNIFDYCGAVKAKFGWQFETRKIIDGEVVTTKLQKIVRYFVSNDGDKIVKRHSDGREIQVEAGVWKQTIANKIDVSLDFSNYDINKKYYIDEIYKQIENIQSVQTKSVQQLSLF